MPALAIVVIFALVGSGLVVAGTYLLAGLAVAMLLSGGLLFAAALFVRSGMRANV